MLDTIYTTYSTTQYTDNNITAYAPDQDSFKIDNASIKLHKVCIY